MSNLIDRLEHEPSRRSGIIFWLIAACALFLFLGTNALAGVEGKWAESAREMFLGNICRDVPLNWRISAKEPLLHYWLIRLFSWNSSPTELTVRLPSALAALLLLAGTKFLGERLFNRTVARLSCWLLLGCYGFLFWGRTVSADMTNAALTVLAAALFFRNDGQVRFKHYLLFYALCCTAMLNKGFWAFFTPVIFVLPYLLLRKRFRYYLSFAHLGGFILPVMLTGLLFLAGNGDKIEPPFYILPEIPGYFATAGGKVLQGCSAFYDAEHIFDYLINLPRLLLPWSPLFLLEAYGMCRCWKNLSYRQKGLFAGLALLLVFFALTGGHRWHDALPLLPFAILITAAGMIHNWTPLPLEKALVKIYFYAVIIIASMGVAVLVAYPVWNPMIQQRLPFYLLFLLPCGGFAVLILMLLDGVRKPVLATTAGIPRKYAAPVLGFTLLSIIFWTVTQPAMTTFRSTKPFCTGLRKHLVGIPPEAMMFWMDEAPEELLFYFDRPGPIADDPQKNPTVSREMLNKLLQENSGRQVVIFGEIRHTPSLLDGKEVIQKESHLNELESALHSKGFTNFSALQPNHKEKPMDFEKDSAPKLAVWVLDVP